MSHFDHLHAIEARLDRALVRLDGARGHRDRQWYEHEVRMAKREIEGEKAFLAARGITVPATPDLTDDELLKELGA